MALSVPTMGVRPAFEHTLVSSTLLMLFSVNQWEFVTDEHMETIRIDLTRMAQGIMAGIGFLGAGAIMKENLAMYAKAAPFKNCLDGRYFIS